MPRSVSQVTALLLDDEPDILRSGTCPMCHTSAPLSPALSVPGPLRRAVVVVGDLLGAVAIVLCIPFVILAIGIPIRDVLR